MYRQIATLLMTNFKINDGVGIIPEGTTMISDNAFYGCTDLTSVTIPDSVRIIGFDAFAGCSGLTKIVIPQSVENIRDRAFLGCTNLKSIQVAEGNTKYDSRDNCNAIIETASNKLIAGCATTIIPNSVTEIDYGVFMGCTDLTSVVIPESVKVIGDCAFNECDLTSIVIPAAVTEIGFEILGDCRNLASIRVAEENKHYDSRNNCNAIIETATNTLIAGCKNTVIPESVTRIGDGAFSGCSDLTSIVIPAAVTEIGEFAFDSCIGLTSIAIPASVTKIGEDAFYGCKGLKEILVPAGKVESFKGLLPQELHGLIVEL